MADISIDETIDMRQQNAIIALLSEPSIRQAAKVSGIPEKTLYNWLRNPTFEAAYRLARRDATQQAMGLLQKYSGTAAAILCKLAVGSGSDAIRLAAASKILDLALKITELEELRGEIDALKAMVVHERVSA